MLMKAAGEIGGAFKPVFFGNFADGQIGQGQVFAGMPQAQPGQIGHDGALGMLFEFAAQGGGVGGETVLQIPEGDFLSIVELQKILYPLGQPGFGAVGREGALAMVAEKPQKIQQAAPGAAGPIAVRRCPVWTWMTDAGFETGRTAGRSRKHTR